MEDCGASKYMFPETLIELPRCIGGGFMIPPCAVSILYPVENESDPSAVIIPVTVIVKPPSVYSTPISFAAPVIPENGTATGHSDVLDAVNDAVNVV